MTTLDKIKLIDFYLHGVDRDLWDFEIPNYDVSLDALRPVIVKLCNDDLQTELSNLADICLFTYIFVKVKISPRLRLRSRMYNLFKREETVMGKRV